MAVGQAGRITSGGQGPAQAAGSSSVVQSAQPNISESITHERRRSKRRQGIPVVNDHQEIVRHDAAKRVRSSASAQLHSEEKAVVDGRVLDFTFSQLKIDNKAKPATGGQGKETPEGLTSWRYFTQIPLQLTAVLGGSNHPRCYPAVRYNIN